MPRRRGIVDVHVLWGSGVLLLFRSREGACSDAQEDCKSNRVFGEHDVPPVRTLLVLVLRSDLNMNAAGAKSSERIAGVIQTPWVTALRRLPVLEIESDSWPR